MQWAFNPVPRLHPQNRQSSQRFRDKAKERSAAAKRHLDWLQRRVSALEAELESVKGPAAHHGMSEVTREPTTTTSASKVESLSAGTGSLSSGRSLEAANTLLRKENEVLRKRIKEAEAFVSPDF